MIAKRLPVNFEMNVSWMLDDCWTTVRWLSDGSLKVSWWLLQDSLMTIANWFLTTNWQLMTVWQWSYQNWIGKTQPCSGSKHFKGNSSNRVRLHRHYQICTCLMWLPFKNVKQDENQWFYTNKVHPRKCLHQIKMWNSTSIRIWHHGGYHGQPPPFALTFSPMSHEIKAQDLFMKHAPKMQIHVLDSSNASNAYITYIRVYKSYQLGWITYINQNQSISQIFA